MLYCWILDCLQSFVTINNATVNSFELTSFCTCQSQEPRLSSCKQFVPFPPKLTQDWVYASALIDKWPYLCLPLTPQSFHFPFLVTKPTRLWNSYRDSRQRVLAILSLSVVASLHSLNTKSDYNWAMLEIKSADVVLHKHGISATSRIAVSHVC